MDVVATTSYVDDDPDTVPEPIAVERNGHAPSRSPFAGLLEDPVSLPQAAAGPIGFAHNGFHIEGKDDFQAPSAPPEPPTPPRGRHARDDSRTDDAGTYGRHSMRFRD